MAEAAGKAIAVLAQPPVLRRDFDIKHFLPWFRKKSDLFAKLKPGESLLALTYMFTDKVQSSSRIVLSVRYNVL